MAEYGWIISQQLYSRALRWLMSTLHWLRVVRVSIHPPPWEQTCIHKEMRKQAGRAAGACGLQGRLQMQPCPHQGLTQTGQAALTAGLLPGFPGIQVHHSPKHAAATKIHAPPQQVSKAAHSPPQDALQAGTPCHLKFEHGLNMEVVTDYQWSTPRGEKSRYSVVWCWVIKCWSLNPPNLRWNTLHDEQLSLYRLLCRRQFMFTNSN